MTSDVVHYQKKKKKTQNYYFDCKVKTTLKAFILHKFLFILT